MQRRPTVEFTHTFAHLTDVVSAAISHTEHLTARISIGASAPTGHFSMSRMR